MDNGESVVEPSPFRHDQCVEEGVMKIVSCGAGRLAGLSCLVATAFLLNACQQNETPGSSSASAYSQKMDDERKPYWQRHCCRRGGQNGNH
jgi:hypothetical protein